MKDRVALTLALAAWIVIAATVPDPAAPHYTAPRAVDQAIHLHFGNGALGLKALRVTRCESRWNPRAVSPGGRYRGLFQFDRQTWRAYGGKGDPAANTPREQARVARKLWRARGWQPWPVCGKR